MDCEGFSCCYLALAPAQNTLMLIADHDVTFLSQLPTSKLIFTVLYDSYINWCDLAFNLHH